MQKGLKAGFVFAAMVAAPLVLRAVAAPQPSPHGSAAYAAHTASVPGSWPWLILLLVCAVMAFGIFVYDRLARIATYLTLAERDFNVLISGMMDHGGRKGRAIERSEWNRMAQVP